MAGGFGGGEGMACRGDLATGAFRSSGLMGRKNLRMLMPPGFTWNHLLYFNFMAGGRAVFSAEPGRGRFR